MGFYFRLRTGHKNSESLWPVKENMRIVFIALPTLFKDTIVFFLLQLNTKTNAEFLLVGKEIVFKNLMKLRVNDLYYSTFISRII